MCLSVEIVEGAGVGPSYLLLVIRLLKGLLFYADENKKAAAARREHTDARKDKESAVEARDGPGLFSFINQRLGDSSAAAMKIKEAERSLVKPSTVDRFGALASAAGPKRDALKVENRSSLMEHEEIIGQKQAKVQHFEDMLRRNQGNQSLRGQIEETLRHAISDLEASKAEHAKIQRSIKVKESSTKFWGKF